ncbi:hypothetical protein ACKKBG_A33015 [Auxenochlorella protothecoides x Auxenochlorella symbiontica]
MPLDPSPTAQGWRFPGEWEPHARTWMGWPSRPDNWRDGARPGQQAFVDVAKAISRFEPVTVGADPELVSQARAALPPEVEVVGIPQDDSWFRDTGPLFLVREGADGREVAGVDWEFNAWGGLYGDYSKDVKIASAILEREGIPCIPGPMILEGGSVHMDGEGTLLTTAECLLHPNRNPGLSQAEIEARLMAFLGVTRVIWLPRGLVADTDTNGHVDNIACFARPGVVVLAWSDDAEDPQYERSREALAVLEAAVDARGRRLEVVKLPQGPAMHYREEETASIERAGAGEMDRVAGTRLAGAYINFYICNGGVVMPGWGIPDADARAKVVLQEVFPDREVVQVYTREILLGGGNVHCITQQQPLGKPAAMGGLAISAL